MRLCVAGMALLSFMNMSDACSVRSISHCMKDAVDNYQWDSDEEIVGDISKWALCFPRALSANLSRKKITEEQSSFLKPLCIKKLNLSNSIISSSSSLFSSTPNLTFLDMSSSCGIFSSDFVFLDKLQILDISRCNDNFDSSIVTDDFLQNLPNLKQLTMVYCYQYISDSAFACKNNLEVLDASCCRQLTDDAFLHLKDLKTLSIFGNWQLTDNFAKNFRCLNKLDMTFCKRLTNSCFQNFRTLTELSMFNCKQQAISDEAFSFLGNLKILDMSCCNQHSITDKAFSYLTNLEELVMCGCNQNSITNYAFSGFTNLRVLILSFCNQETITDDAFSYPSLSTLTLLNIKGCTQLSSNIRSFFRSDNFVLEIQ